MNILDRILEQTHQHVAQSKRNADWVALRAKVEAAPPARGFAAALRGTRSAMGAREPQSTLRVVAEIKKASPSRGVIRADFDPPAHARSYEAGGAAALSVVTDEKFFGGSLDYLRQARSVSSLPILRKDFIIDPFQIYEARAAGADAILLIAGLAPWDELKLLRQTARGAGLDVLLEIHGPEELEPALALEADALGVNNRNLRSDDFHTDLGVTERLVGLVPPEATLISESGIRDRKDALRLARLGVDGILVGEHLMREADPGAAIGLKLGLGPDRAPLTP